MNKKLMRLYIWTVLLIILLVASVGVMVVAIQDDVMLPAILYGVLSFLFLIFLFQTAKDIGYISRLSNDEDTSKDLVEVANNLSTDNEAISNWKNKNVF